MPELWIEEVAYLIRLLHKRGNANVPMRDVPSYLLVQKAGAENHGLSRLADTLEQAHNILVSAPSLHEADWNAARKRLLKYLSRCLAATAVERG
jgi:hypothetical protein